MKTLCTLFVLLVVLSVAMAWNPLAKIPAATSRSSPSSVALWESPNSKNEAEPAMSRRRLLMQVGGLTFLTSGSGHAWAAEDDDKWNSIAAQIKTEMNSSSSSSNFPNAPSPLPSRTPRPSAPEESAPPEKEELQSDFVDALRQDKKKRRIDPLTHG